MTNQVTKKCSTIEKDIATNFFTKLASVIGFQYNLPRSFKNPLVTTNFSINYLVKGFSLKSTLIVKPWPQTLSPKTPKTKTKGPWADTKML